jgi:hypothetical protein
MLFELRTHSTTSTLRNVAPRRIFAAGILLFVSLCGLGCQTPIESSLQDSAALDPAQRASKLHALRSAIADDHRKLEILITKTERVDDGALYQDPEMHEIAANLIELERSLAELTTSASSESATSK